MRKETLAKDLNRVARIEAAARVAGRRVTGVGIALLFLVAVWIVAAAAATGVENRLLVIVAGVIAGYMALNIGANDVANNMGPTVGARALTMLGALAVAAVFEAAGALIAGGDVVRTISKGIIDPALIGDPGTFVWAMTAALFAAALWINLATVVGAPVSTTHSVVGGVMGAGIAAAGTAAVNWPTMIKIAASWVISPILGGVIAALFLAFLKATIIYREDKIAGAKRWVPVLVALMAGVFSAYLVMKGLKKVWRPDGWVVAAIGGAVFAAAYAILRPLVARRAAGMENRNKSVRALFTVPLVCAAALLSFAHGANDVANAVGPLAGIVGAAASGEIAAAVTIPLWVMAVGAAGISVGLFLFGPRLIRTVGEQITKMNPMRAFCVALSAAITVLVASTLGLPVSSTHIAVGGVFGVGFYREWQTARRTHINHGRVRKDPADVAARQAALAALEPADPVARARYRKLVRRVHLLTIVAAWLVTVPLAALLAAGLFLGLRLVVPA